MLEYQIRKAHWSLDEGTSLTHEYINSYTDAKLPPEYLFPSITSHEASPHLNATSYPRLGLGAALCAGKSSIAPVSVLGPSSHSLTFLFSRSILFLWAFLLWCSRLPLPARVSLHMAQASKVLRTPVTIVKTPIIKLIVVSLESFRGFKVAVEISSCYRAENEMW